MRARILGNVQGAHWPLILLILGLIAGSSLQSQERTESPPTFEVASIRENTTGPAGAAIQQIASDTLTLTNIPVIALIAQAYGLRGQQISGIPDWINDVRYDVRAKAGYEAGREQLLRMLQSLLTDRFHLRFRRESRDIQGYAIRLKNDAKPLPAASSEAQPVRLTPVGLTGGNVTIGELAATLSRYMNVGVEDRTGLDGRYDLNVAWQLEPNVHYLSPEYFEQVRREVQDQLGLRFEGIKVATEVFVIESIDRPTPN